MALPVSAFGAAAVYSTHGVFIQAQAVCSGISNPRTRAAILRGILTGKDGGEPCDKNSS